MSLFEQTVAASGGANSRSLTAEQQITRLSEFFDQVYAATPEKFEPGQMIWHKNAELANIRSAYKPHVFIGYLDTPILGLDLISKATDIGNSALALIRDCRAGCLSDYGTFETYLFDSRELTSVLPEATKLANNVRSLARSAEASGEAQG